MRGRKLLLLAISTVFVCWGGAKVSLAAQQPSSPGPAAHRAASTRRLPSIPIPRDERPILVEMGLCATEQCVRASFAKIGRPDRVARFVLYSNLVRLHPADRTVGCLLLAALPRTGREFGPMTYLSAGLYAGESDRGMRALGDSYWSLNRRLVSNLKRCRGGLRAFIAYGRLAIRDSHNDYPNWAARVCRSNPSRFLKAFETLSPKDRHYIAKYVIQPQGCKQIAIVAQ